MSLQLIQDGDSTAALRNLKRQIWFRVPLSSGADGTSVTLSVILLQGGGGYKTDTPLKSPVKDSPAAYREISSVIDEAPVIRVANVKQLLLTCHCIIPGCFHPPRLAEL